MRVFFIAALAFLMAACEPEVRETGGTTPEMDMALLDAEVGAIAARMKPAILDVGVTNIEAGETWNLAGGGGAMPMQSVFKAPLGAAVLAEVDAGRLSLDEAIRIEAHDLSPPYSPLADAWPGKSIYSVRELLVMAVGGSDNTAADVLMKRIGGPGVVQAWITENKIAGMRIDRYERELQTEIAGLPSFRPEWKGETAFTTAIAAVPQVERLAALDEYLVDTRDTTTVGGTLAFLVKLSTYQLLSKQSTDLLLRIMTDTQTGQNRLVAGLPPRASLAHKTGTGRTVLGVAPAANDIGILTLPDGRRYAVAVFLEGSRAPEAERDRAFADVMRAVVKAAG